MRPEGSICTDASCYPQPCSSASRTRLSRNGAAIVRPSWTAAEPTWPCAETGSTFRPIINSVLELTISSMAFPSSLWSSKVRRGETGSLGLRIPKYSYRAARFVWTTPGPRSPLPPLPSKRPPNQRVRCDHSSGSNRSIPPAHGPGVSRGRRQSSSLSAPRERLRTHASRSRVRPVYSMRPRWLRCAGGATRLTPGARRPSSPKRWISP